MVRAVVLRSARRLCVRLELLPNEAEAERLVVESTRHDGAGTGAVVAGIKGCPADGICGLQAVADSVAELVAGPDGCREAYAADEADWQG